eukprot:880473_1
MCGFSASELYLDLVDIFFLFIQELISWDGSFVCFGGGTCAEKVWIWNQIGLLINHGTQSRSNMGRVWHDGTEKRRRRFIWPSIISCSVKRGVLVCFACNT